MQMHKKHTAQSILIGKDNFSVTVYPNIDYAFIVALIVILDDINAEDKEEWDDFYDSTIRRRIMCLAWSTLLFSPQVHFPLSTQIMGFVVVI